MTDAARLTGPELLLRLERAVLKERIRLCDFLAQLAEADRRKCAVDAGYGSLFDFCVERLKLSEDESYKRIQVARAASNFPEIYSYIKDGAISLTAAAHLAPHLNQENALRLLEASVGKRVRAVDILIAPFIEGSPKRDSVKAIRRLSAPPPSEPRGPSLFEPSASTAQADSPAAQEAAAPSRFQFSFEGSAELRTLIERAKDLLWHKYPFARLEDILTEALEDFVSRRDPAERHQKRGEEGRAPQKASEAPRAIPRAVRDAVWARDGGRCVFLIGGRRCDTRRGLELDHILPVAAGGTGDASNLRLLCRAHNDSERRRVLGEGTLSLPF
jgi:hypothetical protein